METLAFILSASSRVADPIFQLGAERIIILLVVAGELYVPGPGTKAAEFLKCAVRIPSDLPYDSEPTIPLSL